MHRIPGFFQAWFSEQRLVADVGRLQYRDAASQVLPTALLAFGQGACGQGAFGQGAWLGKKVVGRLTKGADRHSSKLQQSDRASNSSPARAVGACSSRAQQQRQVAAQDKVQQSLQQT